MILMLSSTNLLVEHSCLEKEILRLLYIELSMT